MGWSDPGTLYATKEAIGPSRDENVLKGLVVEEQSIDGLIYNYAADKLVVAVGLEGMIVFSAEDAVFVVHKDQIPLVKKVVEGFEGSDLEFYG